VIELLNIRPDLSFFKCEAELVDGDYNFLLKEHGHAWRVLRIQRLPFPP
jgi:hypothetical protein